MQHFLLHPDSLLDVMIGNPSGSMSQTREKSKSIYSLVYFHWSFKALSHCFVRNSRLSIIPPIINIHFTSVKVFPHCCVSLISLAPQLLVSGLNHIIICKACSTDNAQNLMDEKKIRIFLNKFLFVQPVTAMPELQDDCYKTIRTKVISIAPI